MTDANAGKIAELRAELDAKRAAAIQQYLATVPTYGPISYEIHVHNPATPGISAEFATAAYRGSLQGYTGGIGTGGAAGTGSLSTGGGANLTAPPATGGAGASGGSGGARNLARGEDPSPGRRFGSLIPQLVVAVRAATLSRKTGRGVVSRLSAEQRPPLRNTKGKRDIPSPRLTGRGGRADRGSRRSKRDEPPAG